MLGPKFAVREVFIKKRLDLTECLGRSKTNSKHYVVDIDQSAGGVNRLTAEK
jgi:hypothetical protein